MTQDEYVRRVEFWLRDLPWNTRRDLLAEIRGHLDELPADTDLQARLGAPEDYAADLRSAAGLERRRGLIAFLRARRPRNLILVVLALTVIGLAIGAVAWIDSYQPIAFAGGSYLPLGEKEVRESRAQRSSSTRADRSGTASASSTTAASPCASSAFRTRPTSPSRPGC